MQSRLCGERRSPAVGDVGDLAHASANPPGPSDASFKRNRTRARKFRRFMEENMRASIIQTMSRSIPAAVIGAWVAVGAPAPARANVITDWDEKAVAVVTPMASLSGTLPYMAQRMMGMVHAAMFDAVNSIEQRYRPYLLQLQPPRFWRQLIQRQRVT